MSDRAAPGGRGAAATAAARARRAGRGAVTAAVIGLYLGFAALGGALQWGLLSRDAPAPPPLADDGADYYIERFVSIGSEADGARYRISGRRLTHYAADNRTELECPYFLRHHADGAARQIRADAGQLSAAHATLRLYGRVRETYLPPSAGEAQWPPPESEADADAAAQPC